MLEESLSDEYRVWYRESRHKARIDHVAQSLLNQDYKPIVVHGYVLEWIRFTRDFDKRRKRIPSSIHDSVVGKYLRRRFPKGSPSRFRGIRAAIRLFIDTDDKGRFPLRMRKPVLPVPALYEEFAPQYAAFIRRQRNVTEHTVRKRGFHIKRFMEFAKTTGVSVMSDITPLLIRDFCCSLTQLKHPTRLGYAVSLRGFMKWAYLEGILNRDLSGSVLTAKHYRYTSLPDTLTTEEVESLVQSPDRSTPVGQRDHAVLLLAARYGMRPSDIRQLGLDNIDWRNGRIALQQSKTGRDLTLPLLPEVSDALSTYLREGRPPTHSRKIFVQHCAPFRPLCKNNNLSNIMLKALRRTGLQNRQGRRGIYLFRHTLATRMMEAGQPIKTIADILGHSATDTTFLYTKVDMTTLRTVATSIKEITS